MRAYPGAPPSDAAPCAPSCRGPGPPSCVAVLVPHQRHHRLLLLLRLRHRLRFSREAARRRRPASTSGDAAKGLPGDGRDEEGSIVAEARASPARSWSREPARSIRGFPVSIVTEASPPARIRRRKERRPPSRRSATTRPSSGDDASARVRWCGGSGERRRKLVPH